MEDKYKLAYRPDGLPACLLTKDTNGNDLCIPIGADGNMDWEDFLTWRSKNEGQADLRGLPRKGDKPATGPLPPQADKMAEMEAKLSKLEGDMQAIVGFSEPVKE